MCAARKYFPFGETWVKEHPAQPTPVAYGYNGKELDEETGYHYYGARYFNPRTQLWQSADPELVSNGELNVFGYARQNPVRNTDPDGARSTTAPTTNPILTAPSVRPGPPVWARFGMPALLMWMAYQGATMPPPTQLDIDRARQTANALNASTLARYRTSAVVRELSRPGPGGNPPGVAANDNNRRPRLALGLNSARENGVEVDTLDEFAGRRMALTYKNPRFAERFGAQFTRETGMEWADADLAAQAAVMFAIINGVVALRGEIHFNVRGIRDRALLTDPQTSRPNFLTGMELLYVCNAPHVRQATTFWMGDRAPGRDQQISATEACGTAGGLAPVR